MKFGKFLQQQVSPEFKEDPVFAGFYSSMIHIASRLSSTHNHAKEIEERHDAAINEVNILPQIPALAFCRSARVEFAKW